MERTNAAPFQKAHSLSRNEGESRYAHRGGRCSSPEHSSLGCQPKDLLLLLPCADNCDWESPLNNEVLRQEQLEVLSQLARCRYTKTARMVHELFEETKAKAQSGEMNRKVFEEKITWLIYLIGALVGSNWTGRLPDVHVEGVSSAFGVGPSV